MRYFKSVIACLSGKRASLFPHYDDGIEFQNGGFSLKMHHLIFFVYITPEKIKNAAIISMRTQSPLIRSRYHVRNARISVSKWEAAVFAG